jgi:NAD(P)-dependent dehydrogenase (short-subunit alcohol dehydrogenase family)
VRLLVTGGASGLGRAVALAAGARGAKVVVADIDRAGSEAVARPVAGTPSRSIIKRAGSGEDAAKLLGGSASWSTTRATAPAPLQMKAETGTARSGSTSRPWRPPAPRPAES